MSSAVILELLDASLLPLVLTVGVKAIGLIGASLLLKVEIDVSFPAITFGKPELFVTVNFLSNLILVLFVSSSLGFSLLRLILLSDLSISPALAAKLSQQRWEGLVVNSRRLYGRAAAWAAVSFFTSFSLYVQGQLGWSPRPLFYLAIAFSVVGAVLFTLSLMRDKKYLEAEEAEKAILVTEGGGR